MISVPVAYFMNSLWLQMFAVHVSFDVLTVSIGVLILAVFGLFTIGSQTLQARFINPVENLKEE
jgi:putative ABC transport system permease protein